MHFKRAPHISFSIDIRPIRRVEMVYFQLESWLSFLMKTPTRSIQEQDAILFMNLNYKKQVMLANLDPKVKIMVRYIDQKIYIRLTRYQRFFNVFLSSTIHDPRHVR